MQSLALKNHPFTIGPTICVMFKLQPFSRVRLLFKQLGTIDTPHRDLVRPDDETMVWLAREVAPPLDASIIPTRGSTQFHSEPGTFLKVHRTDVPDDAQLIADKHIHPHCQPAAFLEHGLHCFSMLGLCTVLGGSQKIRAGEQTGS